MILKRLLPLLLLFLFSKSKAQFSGNALDFDGNNDMVVVSSVPSLFSNLTTNDFTIEAWVNPRGSLFARIFFAQPSTTNFVSMGTSTGNVIYFYVIVNGTTYSVATTAGIPQNQWTHVAARWTAATNSPVVFFNGVQQAGGAGGGSSTGTSGLMTLGTRPGGAQYFNGALDEVRLWNEARTQCEIQSNMNHSVTGVQTNLIANYDFNQGTGGGNNLGITTLPDLSGNAYNGTLTNFALTAATSNWIVSAATVTTSGNPLGGISVSQSNTICSGASFTFPDGSTTTNITSQISHLSTLLAVGGCDSLITTTVNVNPTYSINQSFAVCQGGSYTFPDGSSQSNITAQVVYASTLQTLAGCDSIITTTVNVNPTYSVNESVSVCSGSSYTFPDASSQSNITAQVVYASTLQTIAGCDSIITTTVNVNPTYSVNESVSVCSGSSYTFPDASIQNNITAQVVYASTLQTVAGCDSIINTTVNINPVYAINESDSVCSGDSYTFPDGTLTNNITSTLTYVSTLQTLDGCDSIITSAISIKQVNVSVTLSVITLTADDSTAAYQWLDCGNGYTPIAGETGQSYTPAISGSYAVAITANGCTDTSACFFPPLATNENNGKFSQLSIYPNPAKDFFTVENIPANSVIKIYDVSGRLVLTQKSIPIAIGTTKCLINTSNLQNGIFLIEVSSENSRSFERIVLSR
ncbi:MAG: T9SS type A sorting domain-containing protein [Bacteroidia bacterium]|nr:T9SS type A sorting domain-containing protein [Bacteroidia bacterium]